MVSRTDLNALMTPGAMRELVAVANGSPRAAPEQPEENDTSPKHNNAIIFREVCHYCISKAPILGNLTLTRESLIFEPDSRDASVDERGCSYYQVHLDLVNIAECAMIGVSTDELDIYEQGSIHCNGMLQILLKNGKSDNHLREPRESKPVPEVDPEDAKQAEEAEIEQQAHSTSGAAALVSQGLSKITSVVNISSFGLSSRTNSISAKSVRRTKKFIVFGFFAKEVAHRCTLALIDALDEAKGKESMSPRHFGLSSVPFTSNSLLDILTSAFDPGALESGERSRTQSLGLGYDTDSDVPVNEGRLSQVVETDSILRQSVESRSRILTSDMVAEIIENLPPALTVRDWELSFDTLHDGVSFNTFYKKLDGHNHCLVVLKDDKGGIFGAFTGHIALSYKFYGTAETFVFKFVGGRIRVYRARGGNRCFVYSDERTIVFGGGSNSALAIDDAFRSGTSGVSDTFRNEPLSDSLMFDIEAMEVWTFGNYLA